MLKRDRKDSNSVVRKEKEMKKIMAVPLIVAGLAVFSASLTGCLPEPAVTGQEESTSKERLLENAVKTLTKIDSLDMDIKADMDLRVGTHGLELEMENVSGVNIQSLKNGTSHFKGNMKISALGLNNDLEFEGYQENNEEGKNNYTRLSAGGSEGSWVYTKTGNGSLSTKETTEIADIDQMSITEVLNVYDKFNESIADLKLDEGTVSYDNTDCYLVSGKMTGGKLAELIRAMGQDIPAEVNNNFNMIELDSKLYFRADDEMPCAAEFNLEDTVKNILGSQAGNMNGIEIAADTLKFTILFNSFDKVSGIKVPDEVKNNAMEGIDSLNLQNILMGI